MFRWKSADDAWNEACAEADRLDPGWRWEDLLTRRPAVPAESDALKVVLKVAAMLPDNWPNWASILEASEIHLSPQCSEIDDPDLQLADIRHPLESAALFERDLEFSPRNRRLSAMTKRVLLAAIADQQNSIRLARTIGDLELGQPSNVSRPAFLHLPDLVPMRQVSKLLQIHARLTADEGRIDDALADALAMLTLSEAACEPPMLITILVGFAIRNSVAASVERNMAQGKTSLSALERTQIRFETAANSPMLLLGMRGERAINEDYVRAVESGIVSRKQIAEHETTPNFFLSWWRNAYLTFSRWFSPGFSKRRYADTIRYYTAIVELLKDSNNSPKRLCEQLNPLRRATPLGVQFSQSGAELLFVADLQQRAKLSAVVCALAIERFRLDNQSWPARLDDLVPMYLSKIPLDPFDLSSLRYRLLDDGIVVYSIGRDGKDSSGDIHSGDHSPADIAIRLWNPEFRRVQSSEPEV